MVDLNAFLGAFVVLLIVFLVASCIISDCYYEYRFQQPETTLGASHPGVT